MDEPQEPVEAVQNSIQGIYLESSPKIEMNAKRSMLNLLMLAFLDYLVITRSVGSFNRFESSMMVDKLINLITITAHVSHSFRVS